VTAAVLALAAVVAAVGAGNPVAGPAVPAVGAEGGVTTASAVARAASPDALGLGECYEAALKRSEVLADQAELVLQAEEQYRQAWGALLPSLSASASYLRQDAAATNPPTDPVQRQARVSASVPLFRGFRNFAAIRQAGSLVDNSEGARRWASLQLFTDTAQAFFGVLALEADRARIDRQLELYDGRVTELEARARIGRSRSSDVLSTSAARASLKAVREQAAGQLASGREVLAFITGLDPDVRLADPGDPDSNAGPLEAWLARAADRPDLSAARARLEASRQAVTAARGDHLPSVDAGANWYLERPADKPWPEWDAQIALTLPLFMGGITTSRTRQADSRRREAELSLERLRRSSTADVRGLHRVLASDLRQVAALDDAYGLAEKSYEAIKADYDAGLATNLDVLQSLISYQDTGRAMDRARFQAHLDRCRLKAAAGVDPGKDTP